MRKLGVLMAVVLVASLVSVALASGPRNTGFQVQNLGVNPAEVTIYFYNTDGTVQCTEGPHVIPVGGSKSFFQGWETSPIADCIGLDTSLVSWLGSAVIQSTEPAAVIANIREETEYATGAYVGTPDTRVGHPLILPGLFGSDTYGFTSDLVVQNTGVASTTVDIEFWGSVDGMPPSVLSKSIEDVVIPAQASYFYDVEDDTELPANWIGVGVAISENGNPLAGTVNQRPAGGAAGALFTFDAVAADTIPDDPDSSLPGLMKNYYDYWTGVQVIAVEDATAGDILIYEPGNPTPVYSETFSLNQWESQALFVNEIPGLVDDVLYFGNVDFAAGRGASIGSQRDFPGTSGLGYSGIFASGTTPNLSLPFVARNFWGVSTGFAVKNDGAAGTIDIFFEGTPGTGSGDYLIDDYALGSGESLNLFQWPPGCDAEPSCAAVHPNLDGCDAASCGAYPATYTEKWTGSVRVVGSEGLWLSSIVNERGYEVPVAGDIGQVYNAFNY
jgi:hypothetical protein